MDLGRVGIWSPGLRFGDPAEALEAASELERLGYGALWIPGAAHEGTLATAKAFLEATTAIKIATGIVNVWVEDAATVAAQDAELRAAYPGRFLLGVGISHAPLIGDRYAKPLGVMRAYLDELDAADPPVPVAERCLAALGPKMLELAAERTAGTHPYLTPPEHTALAREALGPDKLVAPEQTVVLEADPEAARARAREFLAIYLGLPNYMKNLERVIGTGEADLADGGSDRLVDATVAWGDEEAIAARVREHLDAGADHVCINVAGPHDALPREEWRRLADALP